MLEHLGRDSEELRASIWDCLEQCTATLGESQPGTEDGYVITNDGQQLELSTPDDASTVSERANLLVGDLVSHVSEGALESATKDNGGASIAIRNLCRALYLAVQFEEEEEEEWSGPEME